MAKELGMMDLYDKSGDYDDIIITRSNKLSRENTVKKPKGLINCGNTCYINTLLQSLLSLKYFNEFINSDLSMQLLFSKLYTNDNNINNTINQLDNTMTMILKCTFSDMLSDLGVNVVPTKIRTFLKTTNEMFNNNSQQDVAEALGYILNKIHEEHAQCVIPYETNTVPTNVKNICDTFFSKEYSPLTELFFCICQETRMCEKCNNATFAHYSMINMPLDIPSTEISTNINYASYFTMKCKSPSIVLSNDEISSMMMHLSEETKRKLDVFDRKHREKTETHGIDRCVMNYMSPKIVQGVNCDKCGPTNAQFKNKVAIAPKVFILQIKRFSFDGSKLFNPIKIAETFKMSGPNKKEYSYSISAVINHSGMDMMSGHYYSYGRNRKENKDQWYSFNDNIVTLCKFSDIDLEDIYLIFYELE